MRVRVVSKSNISNRSVVSVDTKNNWDSLTAEHFLSVSEIVLDLCLNVSKEDRNWIKVMKTSDLIGLHHTVGQYIRNTYGLWHPNQPMVIKDDLGDGHPDGISMIILEKFHAYLNNPDEQAYQDAMSILTQEK